MQDRYIGTRYAGAECRIEMPGINSILKIYSTKGTFSRAEKEFFIAALQLMFTLEDWEEDRIAKERAEEELKQKTAEILRVTHIMPINLWKVMGHQTLPPWLPDLDLHQNVHAAYLNTAFGPAA